MPAGDNDPGMLNDESNSQFYDGGEGDGVVRVDGDGG
jgi:hypothetical protein